MADDLATATEMYDLYLAAEKAILTGQAVSMGGRTLTRADLKSVTQERRLWEQKKASLAGNGGRKISIGYLTPQ